MLWVLHLNLMTDIFKCYSMYVFGLLLSDYVDFCYFKAMTLSLLHLVVNGASFYRATPC